MSSFEAQATISSPEGGPQSKAAEKVEEYQIENAVHKVTEVDVNALSRGALTWKSKATWRLATVIFVQGLSVAAFAIDGGIIGGMPSLAAFRKHFDVETSGSRIAIVIAAMSIGNAVASLFQWISDIWGRRGTAFIGNVILLIGCVLQAAAPNHPTLIVGRLVGGAGCSLSATVGPMYMSEVAPSAYRGLAVGLYCSLYSVGAIAIAVVLFGGSYIDSDWSWRMPMIFQLVPPVIVAVMIYPLTPESPRFLVMKGKIEQAKVVIAKYQTTSESVDDPIVEAQINQIQAASELVDARPWDFRTLWSTPSERYRLMIIIIYAFYWQFSGTGMLNYYLPRILELVGITNPQQQLAINIGMTVASWLSTVAGATIVDRITRRTLLLTTLVVFIFFLSLMAVAGGLYDNGIAQNGVGIWVIVLVYLFQMSNGLLAATLHNIYPNEVLSLRQRAKGMGMYSFSQNVFGFAMTYGVGELLAIIGWKIYFIFIGINSVCIFLTWRLFPEFRYLSLEEIDYIFEGTDAQPVKVSLELQKVKIAQGRQD